MRGSKILISLFAIIFLLSVAWAEVCELPEEEAIYKVRLPTYYDLYCYTPLLNFAWGESGCLGVVEELGLATINPTDLRVILSPDEEAIFNSALESFDDAIERYKEARKLREDIFYKLSEEIAELTNSSSAIVLSAFGIATLANYGAFKAAIIAAAGIPATLASGALLTIGIGGAIIGWVNLIKFDSESKMILEDVNEMLKLSAEGMNKALAELHSKAEELYCAGGGDERYAGEAAAVYARVREFVQKASGVEGRESDVDFPLRWSYVRQLAEDIDEGNIVDSKIPKFANSILGENSLFFDLVVLWRNVKNAKDGLIAKYQSAALNVSELLDVVLAAHTQMLAEKYDLIKPNVIAYFVEGEAITPSRTIISVNELLDGKGLELGARDYISEASNIYNAKGKFYATRAIEKLKLAQSKLLLALELQNATFSFVDELLHKSASIVDEKRISVEAQLRVFQLSDKYDVEVYKSASALLNETKALLSTEGKKIGEIIAARAQAMEKFDEISTMLSDVTKYIEKLRTDALRTAALLNSTIANATKDEIYVEDEKILLDSTVAILSITKNATKIKELKEGMKIAIDNILLKAREKYSYLNTQRVELAQQIRILSEITDVTLYKAAFDKWEQYVEAGQFVPQRTIGKYKEIANSYSSLASQLAVKRADILQYYLPRKARISYTFSDVELGKKASIFVTLEITNDLAIGTNAPLVIQVKLQLPPNAIVSTTDQHISGIIIHPGTVEIWFSRIEAQRSYSLSFSAEQIIAEITSEGKRRLSLSTEKMVERIDIEFNSLYPLPKLAYTAPCNFAEVYFNGFRVPASDRYYLHNVRAGRNVMYVICTTYEPISITRDYAANGSEVEERISVRSNVGFIENAELSLTISNATNPRIYDSAGKYITGAIFQKYGDGYIIKWKVPILSEIDQYFTLKYTISNITAHITAILEELRAKASEANASIVSEEQSTSYYVARGEFEKALSILEAARQRIEAERNLRAQKIAIESELAVLKNKIDELRATNLSRDIALEIELNKMIAAFNNSAARITAALVQNKTSDALKELEKLKKEISGKDIASLLEKRIESAWSLLSRTESVLRAAHVFENVSEEISAIARAKEILTKASSTLAARDWNATLAALTEIDSIIQNVTARANEISEAAKRNIDHFKIALKQLREKWKNVKAAAQLALKISPENPAPRLDTKDIEDKIAKIDSDIEIIAAEAARLNETAFDKLGQLWGMLNATSEEIKFIESITDKQRDISSAALSNVNAFLDQRLKDARTKAEIDSLQALRAYLSKARSAHDNGNYLDSLSYVKWIMERAQEIAPKEEVDLIFVGGVILFAGIAAAAYIILKMQQKPKFRKLRKIGGESQSKEYRNI